jgi:hypothetical protein
LAHDDPNSGDSWRVAGFVGADALFGVFGLDGVDAGDDDDANV